MLSFFLAWWFVLAARFLSLLCFRFILSLFAIGWERKNAYQKGESSLFRVDRTFIYSYIKLLSTEFYVGHLHSRECEDKIRQIIRLRRITLLRKVEPSLFRLFMCIHCSEAFIRCSTYKAKLSKKYSPCKLNTKSLVHLLQPLLPARTSLCRFPLRFPSPPRILQQ